jgi:hypothetical protein
MDTFFKTTIWNMGARTPSDRLPAAKPALIDLSLPHVSVIVMAPHEAARGQPQRHRAQARTERMQFRNEDALQRASRERRPGVDIELEHQKPLETCQRFMHCDTLWERRRKTARQGTEDVSGHPTWGQKGQGAPGRQATGACRGIATAGSAAQRARRRPPCAPLGRRISSMSAVSCAHRRDAV